MQAHAIYRDRWPARRDPHNGQKGMAYIRQRESTLRVTFLGMGACNKQALSAWYITTGRPGFDVAKTEELECAARVSLAV